MSLDYLNKLNNTVFFWGAGLNSGSCVLDKSIKCSGLINVCKGHIPHLVPLEPLLHVEKFVLLVEGGFVNLS